MASGKWVKIKTTTEGIHQIPYAILAQWGFSDPQKVTVFGNGGAMLPKANSAERPDDLRPNGVVRTGTHLLFYANSCNTWTYHSDRDLFEHRGHDFEQASYYYLTDSQPVQELAPVHSYESFRISQEFGHSREYLHHESELNNLLRSGRQWLGERFDSYSPERTFNFSLPNLDARFPVQIQAQVAARSNTTSAFSLSVNQNEIAGQIFLSPVSFSNYEGIFASQASALFSQTVSDGTLNVKLTASLGSTASQGWLDFLTLNATSKLDMQGKSQLLFRHPATLTGTAGESTLFTIDNAPANCVVWEISEHGNPIPIHTTATNNQIKVQVPNGVLHQLACFQPNGTFPQPLWVENVANQNLHALQPVQYLIVTHPAFLSEATRLARIHREVRELSVEVVTTEQIYHEFSSGSKDVSAIRDFIRMIYERSTPESPTRLQYVLLFGDGSYDNRNLSEENPSYIPTYQSETSFHQAETYVTDDFFGFLDAHEGENDLSGRLDVGIGRFPVATLAQATILVDKTQKYLTQSHQGQWKSRITFLADDGDGNVHMSQSNQLADKILATNPEFDSRKVFFDSYKPVIGTSGKTYPEINTLITRTIQEGTLLLNYTGHGSEKGLAHERVVSVGDIQSWSNIDRLALFVTATCEFSRFDNKNEISAGEWVLLNGKGAGIGLFTTTRLVYSAPNFTINSNFYDYIFQKDENGHPLSFGEVMKLTKVRSGGNINTLNFTLLGDPALFLNYPDQIVATDSVNGQDFLTYTEPLKAMTVNEISGSIRNEQGEKRTDFNGEVSITLYDKQTAVKTLGTEGTPFGYNLYQNVLYNGKAEVINGNFRFSFMVPKDIRYHVGTGKISYYATDNNHTEAIGASTRIVVGGSSDQPITDFTGPTIEMGLNDPDFADGQKVGSTPLLWVKLSDESGINTSGIGIGHDITLILNGDRENQTSLNAYYQSAPNTYQAGTISYSLPSLKAGTYTLELKAWDNLNNSSTASIRFEVTGEESLHIKKVNLFPNPIAKGEPAYLSFVHNDPGSWLTLRLTLTALNGQQLQSIHTEWPASGAEIGPIPLHQLIPGWNQLAHGLYILWAEVKTSTGKKGKISGKLMVIP